MEPDIPLQPVFPTKRTRSNFFPLSKASFSHTIMYNELPQPLSHIPATFPAEPLAPRVTPAIVPAVLGVTHAWQTLLYAEGAGSCSPGLCSYV